MKHQVGLGLLLAGMVAGVIALDATAQDEKQRDTTQPAREAKSQQDTGGGDVADDREQIRKSLRTMERVDREDAQTRLRLVEELGISSRDPKAAPQPGDEAPDFELMPLRFYDFQIDEQPITEDNAGELYQPVRLSAFRDKLPVVLIFGSYT